MAIYSEVEVEVKVGLGKELNDVHRDKCEKTLAEYRQHPREAYVYLLGGEDQARADFDNPVWPTLIFKFGPPVGS